jgi:hypothetical protein
MKQKFTIVLTRPAGPVSVQVEQRSLGSAVREAVSMVAHADANVYANGQYEILFACEGWPRQFTPQEASEAAK